MRIRFVGAVLAVTLMSACGGPSVEEQRAAAKEARLAARADSVAQAAAAYDAAAFDTIQWPSDNDMWERGGVVWSFSCQTTTSPRSEEPSTSGTRPRCRRGGWSA